MFLIILLLIFSGFFLKKYSSTINIKKKYKKYLSKLNDLKYISASSKESKIILDNVSTSGLKLLFGLFILLMPYLAIYLCLLYLLNLPFILMFLIPAIPYLVFIK